MVEELEQETQQDPIPKLPKGYVAIKKSGLPPLPAGYVEKKNLSVNGVGVGGTVGNSKAQSSAPTYTPNTDQSNPFSIGGQYNQPKKLDAEGLDLLNTKHDAAIAEQIKKYPLRKIPLTPILDNTALPKPISEIDANEAIARGKQHKIDMETAIDNTTLKVLKQKGIVAGKGSPYYEAERKKIEEKTKPTMIGGIVIKGAEATYHKDKDGNIGLDRNLGFLEGIRKGFNAAVDGEDEANAFAEMNTQQKVEYANKQMEGKPTEYMEERGGVGELLGGATPYLVKAAAAGTLATAAAIAAPETGGASLVGLAPTLTVLLTAPDMIKQGAKDEIMTRYMQLKQERPNIPDEELMKIAEQGEISGGIVGAAEALAFTTTLKLPILKDSKNVLTTYLKGVASSAIHLGGIMAGTKAAQLAERKLEGYNVDTDKAVDEIATTFTENATAGAILNGLISGAHTLPKVVKSAFKFSLKDTPISEIKTALDANVEAGRIPPEVAEQTIADIDGYKTALAKTSDGLTPETQASVAGLIQARDNVAAEMATKDPTQRAVYEQKIEAYNKQIEKITKTNNPLKYEIDEVTGNPIDKVAPELPDVTVPIEGTDKKGVPVGEDVPEPTDPSTPQVKSEGVVDNTTPKGNTSNVEGKSAYDERAKLVDDIKFEDYPNDKEGEISLIKDGKKIATMDLHYGSDGLVHIKWVKVNKDFQGKGLSLLLYGKATEIAQQKGMKGVGSGFVTHSTSKTKGIYKHFNTTELGVSKGSMEEGVEGRKVILHSLKEPKGNTSNIGGEKPETKTEPIKNEEAQVKIPDPEKKEVIAEPVVSEPAPETEKGEEGGGITHAANEVRRQDRGLPEYEKRPESFEKWNDEAEALIKNGYDVEGLIDRMEKDNHDPTPVENAIRKIYYATVDAEVAKNPTDKLLAIQKRLATVGDLANSRAGRNLVSLKGDGSPLSSISDFYVAKMDAIGKDKLTEEQKAEVKKQYDHVQETNQDAANKIKLLEEENARLKAEAEIKSVRSTTKREKKDYTKEREDLKQSIVDKWKNAGKDTLSSDIPYRAQLFAVAPDIAKLMKSYIEEGVTEFGEIVKRLHETIKGIEPSVTEKDVTDILSGKYDAKKETKGDLLAKLRQIKNKKSEEAVKILAKIKSGDFEKPEKNVSWVDNPELQKKFPKEYNAALDAIKAKEDARHEFDIALLRDQMARRTTGEKFTDNLSKAAGTVKAITTGIDDSAVAIQTYVSMLVRPRTGAKAFYQHIRQGLSQKKFDRWLSALHSSSDYKEMRDMGLDVTEPTSLKEREKEEIFNNRFNGTIKIKGKEYKLLDAPLKPFERAFTTLGNVTRVVGYRTISQKYKREGYTPEKDPELFKSLAKRLNTETGRGQVNEYVDMANKVVTMGIWSPKLMAQKFNILGISDLASLALSKSGTKGYYRQLHPKERAAAIRDVAQFATTVMALSYGFALANGGDVDDDPLSSTFMDVKLPNGKSYNFTGGFSGYIRAIAQFVAGKKHKDGKSINTGRLETAGRFFRGKTPPLTSAALNTASGKDFMGQPTTPLNELVNLAPISLRGITQQIQNDGTTSLFSQGIPTFFGFNVKNEKDYRTKSQLAGEEFSKANPDLKVFIDKGISLPEYDPKKISTKYTNGKSVSNLSEQKPKVQQDYITKHEANYKAELTKLKNGTYKVYKNADGGVHIKGNNTKEAGMTYTQFKDLTDDQIKYLEGQLTRRATVKTKKALKFELDDTEKIEEQ